MVRATIKKVIFVLILLIPVQVSAERDLEPYEEIFESTCKDYDIIGSSTKCENELYKVEIPLIYNHELPRARYINLNTNADNLITRLKLEIKQYSRKSP